MRVGSLQFASRQPATATRKQNLIGVGSLVLDLQPCYSSGHGSAIPHFPPGDSGTGYQGLFCPALWPRSAFHLLGQPGYAWTSTWPASSCLLGACSKGHEQPETGRCRAARGRLYPTTAGQTHASGRRCRALGSHPPRPGPDHRPGCRPFGSDDGPYRAAYASPLRFGNLAPQ